MQLHRLMLPLARSCGPPHSQLVHYTFSESLEPVDGKNTGPTCSRSSLRLTTSQFPGASAGPGYSLSRTPQPHRRSLRLSCILRYPSDGRQPYELRSRDRTVAPTFLTSFRNRPFAWHSGRPAASRPSTLLRRWLSRLLLHGQLAASGRSSSHCRSGRSVAPAYPSRLRRSCLE